MERDKELDVVHSVTEHFMRTVDEQSLFKSNLVNLVKEFIRLLDIEEETDEGRAFHPNYIASCRVMDGVKMEKLFKQMKELINRE